MGGWLLESGIGRVRGSGKDEEGRSCVEWSGGCGQRLAETPRIGLVRSASADGGLPLADGARLYRHFRHLVIYPSEGNWAAVWSGDFMALWPWLAMPICLAHHDANTAYLLPTYRLPTYLPT